MLVNGCGYTTGSLLPANYHTISIEPFKNKVGYLNEDSRALYIPLLESKVHQAVVRQFQADGHLKIAEPERADMRLTGELTGFEREELRVSDEQNVTEYRIRITVALKLVDPVATEAGWEEPSFSGEASYYVSGPNAKSEAVALEDALTDLSRRIVERTIENW